MAYNIRTRIAMLLSSHKRRARYTGILSVLAVIVAVGVGLCLRFTGISMVRKTTILDCSYNGNGAHTHDASCYDSEGNLVCPLEERELHVHDDSCYTEERVLTCGQEEREGHVHAQECYDDEGNLVCGLVESEGHHHTDDCYEVVRTLTCGREEITEVHVHGAGCFRTIEVDDGTYETSTVASVSGEQTLVRNLMVRDADGNEKPLMSVMVKVPVGALPTDAAVLLSPLKDDQAKQATNDIEALLQRELGDDVTIKQTVSAQVEFVDAQGVKAEPVGNVQVKAWTNFVRKTQELVVVRFVKVEGSQNLKAELVRDICLVDWDEQDQTPDNENTLQFWMDSHVVALAIVAVETPQPVVEAIVPQQVEEQPTESGLIEVTLDLGADSAGASSEDVAPTPSITYPAQDFEGQAGGVAVAVSAPEGAFPADTTMQVEPVDTNNVKDAVSSAVPGLVDTVAAVDIMFLDASGAEIQPTMPIQVTMTNDEALDEGLPIVLHVDDEGAASVVEQSAITSSSDEVNFDADTFPTYVMAVKKLQQTLTASDGRTYEISVTYTEESGLPEDAELVVREVAETDGSFAQVFNRAKDAATSEYAGATVAGARFFDISLVKDGVRLEPLAPVEVNIVMTSGIGLSDVTSVVHFVNNRKVELVEAEAVAADGEAATGLDVTFTTESFSVFGVVEMTLEKYVLTRDGQAYRVTVTCGPEAGVPKNAQLEAEEIATGDEAYATYVAQAESALGLGAGSATYARLFDIKIVDRNGQKVEIAAPVSVRIELADLDDASANMQVLHFADGADVPDVVDGVVAGEGAVSFVASGFSAYAIVDAPAEGAMPIETLDAFERNLGVALRLSYDTPPKYFTNTVTGTDCLEETTEYGSSSDWFFEAVQGSTGVYRLYTMVNNQKQYLSSAAGANTIGLTSNVDNAVPLKIAEVGNGTFFIKKSTENRWLQHSKGGGGIRFYESNTSDPVNPKIAMRKPLVDDPYELDGRSYGFMNWAGGVTGRAMMAASSTANTMDAKPLTVMCTSDNSSQLFVPNESDISMWTFHWIEGDKYYLSTVVDGSTRYLVIDQTGLSLISDRTQASQIQYIPGTGVHTGEFCLKSADATLTFSGTVAGGFSTNGSVGNEWLYMVELSNLTPDYFRTYSASKVSVSDPSITNSSRVIVYTRSWNETKLKYEYFAIDSEGNLVQVFESGDRIEWTGGQLNTLLWNFVEYYWEGTTDPNYYYELYNQYSEKYLAPQLTDGQTLSDDTIGLILGGRQFGHYFSTIEAWDASSYAYAGLKVENGRIVACPRSESMDFYFAEIKDMNVDDTLTPVETVDNNLYGIEMKIKNFPSRASMSDFLGNNDGGLTTDLVQGLLSTDLKANGYPMATKEGGSSLGTLFSGAQDVNHLFIQNTYSETGYFEFDSAQNYATLRGATGGDFTVYKELGTYDSAGDRYTLKHGQFFPFNDLKPGTFASTNGKNLYSPTGELLEDGDPRKYEQLYSVEYDNKKADTYFGLELQASFTQTPNGLDDWGHDIIFEFTGDDDFWLYVDDELVIDLGGIHSAVAGNVNFRTGEVYIGGTNPVHTTLKDLFYNNYKSRNHTDAEAQAYVNGIFRLNDNGQWVFKDDTPHTMRIFYMERGAGASNLHMRFNLAAIKKGTVQLTKKLDGVDNDDILAEFPYQIMYKTGDGAEHYLTNKKPDSSTDNRDYVFYKDTVNPVKYQEELTIDGVTFNDVFLLKPGETADISFPEGMTEYRIIECGVNTEVYSSVKANGTVLTGTPIAQDSARKNFAIDYATTKNRSKVTYENTVRPEALRVLSITKQLFREDGITPITGDSTEFNFRLYLASEFGELDLANRQSYHVKDPYGYYCKWDTDHQEFVKIGEGISDYDDLTPEQKVAATFVTSIYGAIDTIRAGYTVEVRDVLAGTQYRVEERPWQIPDGYSFQKYEWDGPNAGEVTREDEGVRGVNGVVVSSHDDNVIIDNLKGWGLRMNKVWCDADYMSYRDATYFALFTKDANNNWVKVNNSVRQLAYNANPQTLYWYYDRLPVPETTINDYAIYEVIIVSPDTPEVGADGVVAEPVQVTAIEGGHQIKLDGTQKGEEGASTFTYTVQYTEGEISTDSNVRVDTVTNDRPGIVLKKSNWDLEPLAGATFTLTDADGNIVGEFTSDEDGLITIAYLSENKDYTLTETKAPSGYYGLQAPLTIRLASNGQVTVTGDITFFVLTQATETAPATLTVKDRPKTFSAIKVDGDTGQAMQGVEFELHREVTVDGVTVIDLNPMPGYESLATDQDGVISKINETLPAGTYELWETTTLSGYELLDHIQFTVTPTGEITTPDTNPEGATLSSVVNSDGTIAYTLTINNYKRQTVSFKKVDISNPNKALAGAKFDMYRVGSDGEPLTPALYTGLTSGADGFLRDNTGNVQFKLTSGTYHLVETQAPAGYNLKTEPVVVTVTINGVSYQEQGSSLDTNGNGSSYSDGVYTLLITNSTGQELPMTGGPGTLAYTFGGAAVILVGVVGLAWRRLHSFGR